MKNMGDAREGAKQPERFDPQKAIRLDDPARFEYLPPQELFSLLDAPPGAVVVDFGTGTGTYALLWAKARPDLSVIALDELPPMLDLLRKKLSSDPVANVKPCLSDGNGLDCLRESAARILALNVLHEMGDGAIRQLADLLTPEGQVVFVDWNAGVKRPVGPPREHVHTPAEASARLKAIGLDVMRERIFRYHYALTCKKPRRRAFIG
jgi:ubiquinone/menaquinone biosynthesis C-methylase UbiE